MLPRLWLSIQHYISILDMTQLSCGPFSFKNYIHLEYVTGIYNSSFAMLHNTYFPILVHIIKMEIEFFDIETLAEIKLYLYIGVVNAIQCMLKYLSRIPTKFQYCNDNARQQTTQQYHKNATNVLDTKWIGFGILAFILKGK